MEKISTRRSSLSLLQSIQATSLLVAVSVSAALAADEPFVPTDPNVIVVKVPLGAPLYGKEAEAASKSPAELLQRIAKYLDEARIQGDPRFRVYASRTLASYRTITAETPESCILEVVLLQGDHRFAEALSKLDRCDKSSLPSDQSLVLRASINLVTGNFDQARASCQRLLGRGDELLALACASAVGGMTGQAKIAYEKLAARIAENTPRNDPVIRWAKSIAADLAFRTGNFTAAETLYRELVATDSDATTVALLADVVLAQGKWDDAKTILTPYRHVTSILLRLHEASRQGFAAELESIENALHDQIASARARDSSLHLREEAMYELDVTRDVKSAVQLALRNWETQREPEDARLLLRAALTANDGAALSIITDWAKELKYEDVLFERIQQEKAQ